MGEITNVYWNCPECRTKNQAQIYGEPEDPFEFPVSAVPSDRELRWAPPCERCGNYRLTEPSTKSGEFLIVEIKEDDK